MINTDASGQGSCTYGKTRDHVLELDFVLMGGEQLHSEALADDEPSAAARARTASARSTAPRGASATTRRR